MGPHEMTDEEVRACFKEQERQVTEGIALVDGVKVRRISNEDLDDLKFGFLLPTSVRELISPNSFALVKNITVKEHHGFQADQTMRNIVLGLRLLKKGYVYGNYVLYIRLPDEQSRALESWSRDEHPRRDRLESEYVLNFDEIPKLKKLLEKIQEFDFAKRQRLQLACKRFQRAYEEGDAEDQLIDLMIAFEALFGRREISGSSPGQKIASGCSDLLGKNAKEKQEITSLLTKAYKIRNFVVHGAEHKKPYVKEKFELFDLISEIEGYLRESIKKLLD